MKKDVQQILIDFFKKHRKIDFKKGDTVIRGDDDPSGVYYIVTGYVIMSSILEDGTEMAIHIFKPGSFIPMVWALGGVENSYFYKTLSHVETYKVQRSKLIEFLYQNPEVLIDLTSRILVGLDGILYTTKHLLNSNSIKKVAITMLVLTKRFGKYINQGEVVVDLPLTHQDIARFSGISRETASIAIEKLRKRGILSQKNKKFVVKDLDLLEKV